MNSWNAMVGVGCATGGVTNSLVVQLGWCVGVLLFGWFREVTNLSLSVRVVGERSKELALLLRGVVEKELSKWRLGCEHQSDGVLKRNKRS